MESTDQDVTIDDMKRNAIIDNIPRAFRYYKEWIKVA